MAQAASGVPSIDQHLKVYARPVSRAAAGLATLLALLIGGVAPWSQAQTAGLLRPDMPSDVGIVLQTQFGELGDTTDLLVLGSGDRANGYFFVPPFRQSGRAELNGPAEGPFTLAIELLPIFPEKARTVVLNGLFDSGPIPPFWPAQLEYIRISVPTLEFSTIYRGSRVPSLIPGASFRFRIDVPRRVPLETVNRALASRGLTVALDLGWGPLVPKTKEAVADVADFYFSPPRVVYLPNGLRVNTRERLLASTDAIMKEKLGGIIDLDVEKMVTNHDHANDLIQRAFRPLSDTERAKIVTRDPLPAELMVPVTVDTERPLSESLFKIIFDKTSVTLGSAAYKDTRSSHRQTLRVGTEPPQTDLNAWRMKSSQSQRVMLRAPANCRTPVVIGQSLQLGQQVRVMVTEFTVTDALPISRPGELQVILGIENSPRAPVGRSTSAVPVTMIVPIAGRPTLTLSGAECDQASGSVSVGMQVQVAE